MNVLPASAPALQHAPALAVAAIAQSARHERRERDFGVGYGSSSGYAATRRYVRDWGLTRFRCL